MKLIKPVLLGILSSIAVVSTAGCSSSDDGSAPGGASADVVAKPPAGAASQTPPAATPAGKNIDATRDAKVGQLERIITQHVIDAKDDASLQLFELGGGDPAMNGDHLYLAAEGEHGGGGVFDLGIDINDVKKVEATAAGTIRIVAEHDTIDQATGEIKSGQPYEATVTYKVQGDTVAAKVHVKRPDGEADVQASTDAGEAFLGRIFERHQAEDKSIKATVYETGGGDPAMNGSFPFLVLANDAGARIWDLGINISGISKVVIKSPTELRLEGTEDVNPSDIKSQPVFYSVKFSINPGDDGELNDRITLTKLAQ